MISRSAMVAIGALIATAACHFCLHIGVVPGLVCGMIVIIILGVMGKE